MPKMQIRIILLTILTATSQVVTAQDSDRIPQSFQVPLRDSTMLSATVYLPAGTTARPTILVVNLSTSQDDACRTEAAFFVGRGYNFVVQHRRPRIVAADPDSQQLAQLLPNEWDGFDTVDWIARQTWSDGRVGTYGAVADGFAQYLLAGTAPPHLVAAYVISAPFSLYRDVLVRDGAFRKELAENFLGKENASALTAAYAAHPNFDGFWQRFEPARNLKTANIPITQVTGWYDAFLEGTITAFTALQQQSTEFARKNQRLIIGPWAGTSQRVGQRKQGELTYPQNADFEVMGDAARWFDKWLKSANVGIILEPPVKYYLLGALGENFTLGNVWQYAADWPPKSKPQKYYLQINGNLAAERSRDGGNAEGFTYDPLSPVPTTGGANLTGAAGPFDQRAIETRPDVLLFTSPPLPAPLCVAGRVQMKLFASSSVYDTDFTVKLTDVYPDGRSILVTDGIVRARYRNGRNDPELLRPGKIEEYWIDLGQTAIIFNTDHRIRLAISSSNSPRFEPNPNTARPPSQSETSIPAVNTIYYGGKWDSCVELPIIPLPQ